ncbi:HemK2/MTQ2 family protein methyltransferase [Streptomyces sp. NPDC088354]|uniref:HemK2/MTQ2 family protein methyltransferase n=1 Tax=unclassified Streptomyces TaxID=2593676 RepID=UPI0029B59262|nr:HemK2/MTQ2 family protein methyltransferase [Streptomyces sp. MI02-7b]MDX3075480.1 class I SAM-dependent methyltransferase [Streptomyces sp. MI02-7b]
MAIPLGSEPERLVTLPGVYAPQHDTHILIRAVNREGPLPGVDVLDIGTGSGVLAVRAARSGARVTAIDISRRAVWCARINALLARRRITVRRGDLGIAAGGRFDMVLSNPPYVPSENGATDSSGTARAWDGGTDGRAVVDRVCAAAPHLLRPGGVLLMVHSGLCGVQATVDLLRHRGLSAQVTDRELIPFGPVLRRRLPWLREQGLVEDGQDKEELVVIRAEHS